MTTTSYRGPSPETQLYDAKARLAHWERVHRVNVRALDGSAQALISAREQVAAAEARAAAAVEVNGL